MVDERLFEQGRKELEALLNREVSATEDTRRYEIQCWIEGVKEEAKQFSSDEEVEERFKHYTPDVVELELKEEPVFIYVRTDQDYFVGRGTHQGVINVGNGLVAKGPIDNGKPTIYDVMRKFPNILPFGYGDYAFVAETIETLRSTLGDAGIVSPSFKGYRVGWNIQKDRIIVSPNVYDTRYRDLSKLIAGEIEQPFPSPNVMITEDLRDSGRFGVVEYDDEVAKSLVNGNQLIRNFNVAFEYLMQHYIGEENVDNLDVEKEPFLKRKPHGPDFSGETAIKNMFLLQVPTDRKENGRLVIGDVDHVCMFYYRAPHS